MKPVPNLVKKILLYLVLATAALLSLVIALSGGMSWTFMLELAAGALVLLLALADVYLD